MHHLPSGRGEPDHRQFPHYYHYFKSMLQCLNNAMDREMPRIIIQTSILHNVLKTTNIKICKFPSLNRRCGILQAQCAQEASLHIGLVINHLKFVPFRKIEPSCMQVHAY